MNYSYTIREHAIAPKKTEIEFIFSWWKHFLDLKDSYPKEET